MSFIQYANELIAAAERKQSKNTNIIEELNTQLASVRAEADDLRNKNADLDCKLIEYAKIIYELNIELSWNREELEVLRNKNSDSQRKHIEDTNRIGELLWDCAELEGLRKEVAMYRNIMTQTRRDI